MLEQPLVSIIIPTYNRAHLIGETLDSILLQNYENWECIVVDDGSTDTTEALLKNYIKKDCRFQYYKRPDHHLPGGNGARNFGFIKSKGKYIQWFDSDDLMLPQKIELSVYEIENQNKDVVISNYKILGKKAEKRKLKFDNLLKYHIAYGNINTPMCFFKRESLKDFAFDETLYRSQEFEFFTRLFGAKSFSFLIITEPLSKIRFHSQSITGKFERGDENSIASMLFSKLSAVNFAIDLDVETQKIVKKHFERALWKSLIFRHKQMYWKYLDLYTKSNKNISQLRKLKLVFLASFFFMFNRGGQLVKKQFFN